MKNKINKIKELIQELNQASDSYYNSDISIMTDKQWDNKFDELKQLEKETNCIMANSPTQIVGYEVKSDLKKVTHSIPLKSLAKTKSINELIKFKNNKEIIAMLKGDGLTCEIIYNKGRLVQGSTRGNSIIGEDITHNVNTFKNIPKKIDFKGYLKLAGESVIFDKDFVFINNKLNDKNKYSHSRNLVAGSVRQLNSKICSQRNVNFMAFSLLECKDINGIDIKFDTLINQFSFLYDLGFYIIPYKIISSNTNKLENSISYLKQISIDNGIPIDGIVFGFNNLAYAKNLGETNHHPLCKIAFKFYDSEYETRYIKTKWQVSRNAIINPVGIFQPVDLDGAITQRATLHNLDYFKKLQLGKDDVIVVARQNQVIPKILKNRTKSNTEVIPKNCPICHSKTKIKLLKTARILICTNENCPSKKVAQIEHYCSRNAMNIVGLSESTILKFIDKDFIKDILDIYKLQNYKDEIINMEGFKEKSYNNLINSIEKSKECKLSSFIYALGIPNVGLDASILICKRFNNNLNLILEATGQDFLSIDGIGRVTVNNVLKWISNRQNYNLLNNLLNYVNFVKEQDKKEIKDGIFLNKKIYCTGTFENYKKKQLKEIVENNGGIFTNGYTKSLDFLVVGKKKGSSKVNKAEKDNIKVITENDFIKLIK